jgi:hypothetical protein
MASDIIFSKNNFKNTFVILSGKCPKCNNIIDHKCPNGKMAIAWSQRSSNVNLKINENTYDCQFCPEPINHNHHCNF